MKVEISTNPNISVMAPFEICATCPLLTKVLDAAINIDGQEPNLIDLNCMIRPNQLGEQTAHIRGMGYYTGIENKLRSNTRTPDLSGTPPENCPPIQPDFTPEALTISDISKVTRSDFDRGW